MNNSWGFTEAIPVPDTLAEVIRRAATEPRDGLGALVVFAAGNDNRTIEDDELQALPEVLCVSATDSYGYPTNYTNTGPSVDVAAPSATVSIAPEEGTTTTFGGTSAAAPVATGLAAWAVSQDPSLSAAELMELLEVSAEP
ncbi:MAG: S8 family serine peptidase, partial [bacterium]